MANIYLVNYWVPFPSSEYGGEQIVIADSEEEAIQFIIDDARDWDTEHYKDYKELIEREVKESIRYELAENNIVKGIVKDFIT